MMFKYFTLLFFSLSIAVADAQTVTVSPATGFSGTPGSIPFAGSTGTLIQNNANLFWDNTNNRLGVGTSAPSYTLHVHSSDPNYIAYFDNNFTFNSNSVIVINNTLAGRLAVIAFQDNTSNKWQLGKQNDNSFTLYDYVNALYPISVSSTGNIIIGEGAGKTVTLAAHVVSSGNPPTVSSCGTSPTISGTDTKFTVNVGSGVVTACTVTFAGIYASAPVCTVSDNSATISSGITAVSTTALTVGTSASIGGGVIYGLCIQ